VAGALVKRGCSVAVLGAEGERDTISEFLENAPGEVRDLSGKTSVGVLAAALRSADLLVTNDTGPMHLAAAVGTPALALFGSTSPTWTRPWGEAHRVLEHPVPCAPCFRRTCGIGYLCLTGISSKRVEKEALNMLQRGER
jgi:ADP-heptose:LPS heptosyltransferase